MALLLKPVPALQGARWMRDGFRLFGKHPLAFSVLLVSFLLSALALSLVPYIGSLVVTADADIQVGVVGLFVPQERYCCLVVVNNASVNVANTDGIETGVAIYPAQNQIQD